jgi:hypothetical protein
MLVVSLGFTLCAASLTWFYKFDEPFSYAQLMGVFKRTSAADLEAKDIK